MALKTARICASSQPMSTASSRASWARPRISSRFWFRTLIFSRQETGLPSGCFQVGRSKPPLSVSLFAMDIMLAAGRLPTRGRKPLLRLLLAAVPAAGDDFCNQAAEADRALGMAKGVSILQKAVVRTEFQADEVAAEQALLVDDRAGIGRQFHPRVDVERE